MITREVECQVNELDLRPEVLFETSDNFQDISCIVDEDDEPSTNNNLMSNIIQNLNKEIKAHDRTIDLQDHQIKVLKETIKKLERSYLFERTFEDKSSPHIEHLKISVFKLICLMPKLSSEGEGLVNLILSLLFNQNEIAEIQEIRFSKNTKNLKCFLAFNYN